MRRRTLAVCVGLALLVASLASAQFRRVDSSIEAHRARPESFDGRFHYCRAIYRANPRGDGGSWLTDYPLADIDLSIRLSELTKIDVSFDGPGQPRHLIVSLSDDELFHCPVIIMQEVGRLLFTREDAARLRTYLLKGGFLWVDDFWGSYAWQIWETEIRKASERGADSAEVHARAISDRNGRVMVFMTHNTDVSDSWEREGEDPQYFYRFSIDGYRVAVNVLLDAMTH
jgi:Domain of unknown function (DUF4159)